MKRSLPVLNPLLKQVKQLLFIKGVQLNRLEVIQFLESFFTELRRIRRPSARNQNMKPFLELISSLKRDIPLSIPILRDIAFLVTEQEISCAMDKANGIIMGRINRLYLRLCRNQEELGSLDLKKAPPGVSPEDFIFSQIDFSRYREMNKKIFEALFPEGLTDFDETFFRKNFGLDRKEAGAVIEKSYRNMDGLYKIQHENPLILSIMRTLEISLETTPLFTAREIDRETDNLLFFVESRRFQGMELLFPFLVMSLDGVLIHHEDSMTTKLFISEKGDLSATFQPANKPWTRVLIPNSTFGIN